MTHALITRRPTGRNACDAWGRLSLVVSLLTVGPAWAVCSVSSTGMSFGAYQPLLFSGKLTSADVLSTGTIAITCSAVLTLGSYTLALGPNTVGMGDGISTRYMANSSGGANMMFNIYTDSNRSLVWGNGNLGSLISGSLPIITIGSQTQNVTVYGKIPAGQNNLKAGSYSGSMRMTLTYNP